MKLIYARNKLTSFLITSSATQLGSDCKLQVGYRRSPLVMIQVEKRKTRKTCKGQIVFATRRSQTVHQYLSRREIAIQITLHEEVVAEFQYQKSCYMPKKVANVIAEN